MTPFRKTTAVAVFAAALFAVVAVAASAIAIRNPELGYSVDLPIGWTDGGSSDPYHIGLLSPNQDAMLQIIALDPSTGQTGREIGAVMLDSLATQAEQAEFTYLGRSATLSDVTFVTSGNEVRGYMVTIDTAIADYALLAFALLESYEMAHDHLLSALDSFALDDAGRLYPGPISAFFVSGPADSRPSPSSVPFLGRTIPVRSGQIDLEAASVLVDREARILAPYGALDRPEFEAAWRRYFRMIYRDNYQNLISATAAIEERLQTDGVPRVDYPHEILAWLQAFDFERTGGLSDFRPPISCLATGAGDCDSLALTYVIILHQLGFDAIVMVSDRYAHALAAVDTFGPGARFPFEGTDWLVAELTEDVALGQIAANQSDPAGWIGVRMTLAPVATE